MKKKVKIVNCIDADNYQKYLDSFYEDRDGYQRCNFCEYPTSNCSCVAFVDKDGEEKCKKCKEIWTYSALDIGKCDYCSYKGE